MKGGVGIADAAGRGDYRGGSRPAPVNSGLVRLATMTGRAKALLRIVQPEIDLTPPLLPALVVFP